MSVFHLSSQTNTHFNTVTSILRNKCKCLTTLSILGQMHTEKLYSANLTNRYSAPCWRPVMHVQTWASYNALYRFGRLSLYST